MDIVKENATTDSRDAMVERLKQKLRTGVKATKGSTATPASVKSSIDDIPASYYDLNEFAERSIIEAHEAMLEKVGVENNYFTPNHGVNKNTIDLPDKSYINFSGYNYLGLSGHQEVNGFVNETINQYGTSASASRIVAGNLQIHDDLEKAFSDALGTEDCVVGVGGYIVNLSTIAYMVGKEDLVIHDELSHNSIIMGCELSGATRLSFPHNDIAALDKLLSQHRLRYKRVLIITEGVFSMDGDIAHIPALIEVKRKHKALLMVDEAHSIGTIGDRGMGVVNYYNLDAADIDIIMGTLSKAFASCGGFICGSATLIKQLKYFAPGLVLYSAGLSPQNTAAAYKSLQLMLQEPGRVQTLNDNAVYFLSLLKAAEVNTGPSHASPVVPVITGDDEKALRLVTALKENGVNVHAMLYPSVPREQVRLRFFISATHTKEELKLTADTIIKHLSQSAE